MFTLLLLLTIGCLLVPMLPALIEWRRPSDVEPLQIDETDALDPPFLAQRFADQLRAADDAGAARFAGADIARWQPGPATPAMPLQPAELATRRTARAWHISTDARLPEGLAFDGDIAVEGNLDTAPRAVHRALWARGRVRLARGTRIARWAHGDHVEVGAACRLDGRVSANAVLSLGADVDFTLLHAPTIAVVKAAATTAARPVMPTWADPSKPIDAEWPAAVRWDTAQRRGLAGGSVGIPAGKAWQGDLVCHGQLSIGAGCQVDGSLKARGGLVLGAGCRVTGSVFAEGAIHLHPGCVVLGAVVSETALRADADCIFGAPGAPTTAAAPAMSLAPGVTAHGTVWADHRGRTLAEAGGPADAAPATAWRWPATMPQATSA